MNDIPSADTMMARAEIWRPSAALNPERLEYLWKLTDRIAWSTSIPETLRGERVGGTSSTFTPFDERELLANVFAVVEQADRWNISPFALLAAAAIVRGKLTFEGKVISAVLDTQFGVKLHHYYRGEAQTDSFHIYICDEELPEEVLAELEPGYRHDRFKIMDGSVKDWKTTSSGSPWRPSTYADMLVYRGDRQWARVYKSAAILGVVADDEMVPLLESAAQTATPIGQRFAAGGTGGFSADNIKQLENDSQPAMEMLKDGPEKVADTNTEVQPAQAGSTASAKPSESSGGPAAEAAGRTDTNVQGDPGTGSNPDVDGASGNGQSANSTSDASSPDVANGGGADTTPPVRITADSWRKYHSALARVNSAENLEKAHKKFWSELKAGKNLHADDMQLAKDIHDNHLQRIDKKIDASVLATEVEAWIVKLTQALL